MITIPLRLEIGECFDRLSILYVKVFKTNNLRAIEQMNVLSSVIRGNIGEVMFDNIIKSVEFDDLYKSNLSIFDGVEKAKNKEISGYDLDNLNKNRWIAKNKLQEKFFGKKCEEIKTYVD